MTVLRAAPYSLDFRTLIIAKAKARNAIGWNSNYSSLNTIGAKIQREPSQMAVPTRGSLTNFDRVQVNWLALANADTGDSTITSYNLEKENDQGAFEEVVGFTTPFTGISHTLTAGIVSGKDYKFRIRAVNKWGFGFYSTTATIQASAVPNNLSSAVVTSNVGTNVRIAWAAPNTNGNAITAYDIKIKQADGQFSSQAVYCNGTQGPIISARACEIPLTTLRQAPYSLTFNTVVVAKVSSTNAVGSSAGYSPVNTAGAKIYTEPVTMAAPVRGSITHPGQV